MNLTSQFIIETAKSELTQNEINSFKWGNTPTEETFLKSAIIKAYECMNILYWEDGSKRVKSELIKWVNDCEDAKELDKKNYRFYGHAIYDKTNYEKAK